MTTFDIKTKLTFNTYLLGSFSLLYSSLWLKLISILSFLLLIIPFLIRNYISVSFFQTTIFMVSFIVSIFVLLFFPFFIILMNSVHFYTDKRIKELIKYEFSESGVLIIGESFNTSFDWKNLYKVKIIKGWLFLYQNKLIANFVKVGTENSNDVSKLRAFLIENNLL